MMSRKSSNPIDLKKHDLRGMINEINKTKELFFMMKSNGDIKNQAAISPRYSKHNKKSHKLISSSHNLLIEENDEREDGLGSNSPRDTLSTFKINLLNKFKTIITKIKGVEKLSEEKLILILWANEFEFDSSLKLATNYLVKNKFIFSQAYKYILKNKNWIRKIL